MGCFMASIAPPGLTWFVPMSRSGLGEVLLAQAR